jgi:hypothetical protein
VKLKTIASILACIFLFNSCRDVIFNNPLDPDASRELLKIIKSISTNLSGEGDITNDGEKLWKINTTGSVYAFDIESGVIIRSISGITGTGICLIEDRLYVCNGTNILYSYDSLSGDLIDQISTTDIYPAFLSSSDGLIILYDLRSSSFFRYDPISGSSEQLFQITGFKIGGIEVFREGILFSDQNTNTIYYYSIDGEMINMYLSPATSTRGLTIDSSDYIYLLTLDGQLYKVSLP